jgi:hypothetical protein
MKQIIFLIACISLFAQCRRIDNDFPNKTVEKISRYDTLGLPWLVCDRGHIIYYFQDDPAVNNISAVFEFTDEHENAYTTIDQVFKAQLPHKLHMFVWLDEYLAEQKLGHPLGWAIPEKCELQTYQTQTLGHEMTHILTYWAGGIPPTTKTRFVNEGVAVAFDLSGRDKMAGAKAALAGQNIQSVTDFWSGSYQSASEEIFYPVAGAFMDFMYKQNMPNEFQALIKNQTQYDAENIYGKARLDSLIAEFDKQVGL